jgi:mono/diheme cytochrome c family protein
MSDRNTPMSPLRYRQDGLHHGFGRARTGRFSAPVRAGIYFCVVASILWISPGTAAQQARKAAAEPKSDLAGADIARGKYLVEDVAMCGQCHTPRDGNGALDRSRTLDGAPVFMKPANGDANWPLTAPRIGGTPPAGDADMVKLLTTGIWTNGRPLRFPMMPFRMSEADARDVVAYLKTVRQP